MSLCQLCRSIDFSTFTAQSPSITLRNLHLLSIPSQSFPSKYGLFYYSIDKGDRRSPECCIAHHKSVDALRSSATACRLCELIADFFEATLRQMQKAWADGFRYNLSDYDFWLCGRLAADGFQVLGRVPDRHQPTKRDIYRVFGGIGFCVNEGHVLSQFVSGRVVPPSPVSPGVLKRIMRWLMEDSLPPHASSYGGTFLPTRLLKISSDGLEIGLQEPDAGVTGKYVALSHCWGQARLTTVLTTETAGTLRAGVRSATLPQTFRDAVWVAHVLGFRFLWIDSLCILQDDAEDWARESAKMKDVYGNASLTIAADRAAHSAEGFLSNRPEREYVSIPLTIEGQSGNVLVFPLPAKYAGDTERCISLEDEPLTARGWALQERHLSRRILHFGYSQIFLESDGGFLSEDMCSARVEVRDEFRYPPRYGHVSMLRAQPDERWRRHIWFDIVEQYSRRKLTLPSDKLPALAGLAKLFARETNSTDTPVVHASAGYLAGLWPNSLADLCWQLGDHSAQGTRPVAYRAPSWSWASIDGDIAYSTGANHLFRGDLGIAVVQDARVDLATTEAPFGEVRGGWVHLKAVLLPTEDEAPNPNGSVRRLIVCVGGVSFAVLPEWDAEAYRNSHPRFTVSPADGKTALWLIPLAWLTRARTPGRMSGPKFLIVKAAEHDVRAFAGVPAFRRVGCASASLNQSHGHPEQGLLMRDVLERKWADAKANGEFGDILLL